MLRNPMIPVINWRFKIRFLQCYKASTFETSFQYSIINMTGKKQEGTSFWYFINIFFLFRHRENPVTTIQRVAVFDQSDIRQ